MSKPGTARWVAVVRGKAYPITYQGSRDVPYPPPGIGYVDSDAIRIDVEAGEVVVLPDPIPADPWDACLSVDPPTGQPDHPHGDSCCERECCE